MKTVTTTQYIVSAATAGEVEEKEKKFCTPVRQFIACFCAVVLVVILVLTCTEEGQAFALEVDEILGFQEWFEDQHAEKPPASMTLVFDGSGFQATQADIKQIESECDAAFEDFWGDCVYVGTKEYNDAIVVEVMGNETDLYNAKTTILDPFEELVLPSYTLQYAECNDDENSDVYVQTVLAFYGIEPESVECATLSSQLCDTEANQTLAVGCCAFREQCYPSGHVLNDGGTIWLSMITVFSFGIVYTFARLCYKKDDPKEVRGKMEEQYEDLIEESKTWLKKREWFDEVTPSMFYQRVKELAKFFGAVALNIYTITHAFVNRPTRNIYSEDNFSQLIIRWVDAVVLGILLTSLASQLIIWLVKTIGSTVARWCCCCLNLHFKDDAIERGISGYKMLTLLKNIQTVSSFEFFNLQPEVALLLDKENEKWEKVTEARNPRFCEKVWYYSKIGLGYFFQYVVVYLVLLFTFLVKVRNVDFVVLMSVSQWTLMNEWLDFFGFINQISGLLVPDHYMVRGLLQGYAKITLDDASRWVDVAGMMMESIRHHIGFWGIIVANEVFEKAGEVETFLGLGINLVADDRRDSKTWTVNNEGRIVEMAKMGAHYNNAHTPDGRVMIVNSRMPRKL